MCIILKFKTLNKLYFVKLINGTLYFDDNIQYVSYLSKNELMFGNSLEEILAYFNQKYDLERAVFLIKRNTRHFAKRQLTWFRREKDVRWIDKSMFARDDQQILEELIRQIETPVVTLSE